MFRDFELALKINYNSDYDMNLDASTLNEFATIIFPIIFSWLSAAASAKPFHKLFNNPDLLYEDNGLENIFR